MTAKSVLVPCKSLSNLLPKDMHTPDRGRFAYVPFMMNAQEYSAVTNPYGMMRSPWNTDPNPFLTRHDHVFGFLNNRQPSGCLKFKDTVRKDDW